MIETMNLDAGITIAAVGAAALAAILAFVVPALLELRRPLRGRHRARPPWGAIHGRGMPIPLGHLPPLQLGPWPGCVAPLGVEDVQQTAELPAVPCLQDGWVQQVMAELEERPA